MATEKVSDKLDQIEETIMSGLKDFQKATVNRIAQLFIDGQKRILVSDEVGLGKTLIARGTVAKLAKIRKAEGDKLVKVVYICSNIAIADQNLNKLRISSEVRKENAGYSRLSMQHLNIFNQENDTKLLDGFIQLIPLTPDTSFRMTTGAGTVSERALMFAILRRLPELQEVLPQIEVLMKNDAYSAWSGEKQYYENAVVSCDIKSKNRYLKYMSKKASSLLKKKQQKNQTVLKELLEHCKKIKSSGNQRIPSNEIINKLRNIFAQISLDKLEPDLVIMDEFQRFKYLINSENNSEINMLTNKFFNSDKVRMLLLSATPYKMYSTLEEIDETQVDEHYKEFLDVMDFLNVTEEEKSNFKTVWSNYSIKLKEITKGSTTVIEAKNAAEGAMYQHICRTERISATESADMINDNDINDSLEVLEQDIKSYMQAQALLEEIAAPFNVPIDYIKSTPYIMSFMKDYQLKKHIEKHFKDHPDEVSKMNKDTFWLKKQSIDKYEKIPCNNARLNRVMSHVFKENAEQLLWVPPSFPYYKPQGVYKNAENFSKTLVFSSWEMVPRMIASLLSYESERRTTGKLANMSKDTDAHYFHKGEKRYPPARLNFSVGLDKKPRAMNLFCLLYPSQFLADCYDPVDCLNRGLSLKEIEAEISTKISAKLDKYEAPESGAPDNTWYYLAPLLLDSARYAGYVDTWLDSDESLAAYEDDEKTKKQKGFLTHLNVLKSVYRETFHGRVVGLGKKPNDLIEVLTDMAIASPAICIHRTYKIYSKNFSNYLPSQIAKLFINRMNSPESTAIVELAAGKKNNDAHWENLLTYCKNGNLQAMFDEYAHLITNGLDNDEHLIDRLHSNIAESMNIRTTTYNVDTYNNFKAKANGKEGTAVSLRTHFAVAFTKGENKESDADRKKVIRNAFNSPFRPFVLASTSIGQEGLDFHNYCRRIVHWNLPSNPIDLEQREGRINRFECLAIRQNVAKRYGDIDFKKDNVWTELFDEAVKKEKAKNAHTSDLIPFWGLTEREDMVKIERIVPMFPFSRDEIAYERLIKILSLYRLTLGQARQEELLEYIFNNCENTEDMKDLFINLSPYYKDLKK